MNMIQKQIIKHFGDELIKFPMTEIVMPISNLCENKNETGQVFQLNLIDYKAYVNCEPISELSENLIMNLKNYLNVFNSFYKPMINN